jgi:hypothetical protein
MHSIFCTVPMLTLQVESNIGRRPLSFCRHPFFSSPPFSEVAADTQRKD